MFLAKCLKERKKEEEEDLEFALIDRRRAAARGAGKNCTVNIFGYIQIRDVRLRFFSESTPTPTASRL